MARLAVILPHESLAATAAALLQEIHMEQSPVIHYGGNPEEIPLLVDWAKKQEADIILTRGLIAMRVRQCCNISVVEMRTSAQELGLLIQQVKEMVQKPCPSIALVGTANMFADYSRLDELFGVTLLSYQITQDDPEPYESIERLALQAIRDHADAVIGGKTACLAAQRHGVPCLFLAATQESIREGLRVARRVSYAIDQEKNNAFEIQAMLDSSFSILIRFNRNGLVTAVNRSAIARLNWKNRDFHDKPILSLLSGISQTQLQQVLLTGKALHSVLVTIDENQFVANLTPIRTAEGNITGGFLSCDELARIETASVNIRREQRRLRHPALRSFDDLPCHAPEMLRLRDTARQFALSDSPILILGEPGSGHLQLAECIHSAGPRREMPFISVNCAELRTEEQLKLIFGSADTDSFLPQSMCAAAHMGTLFLQNPESLSPAAQNRLLRLVTQKLLLTTETLSPYPLDVRVICSTEAPAGQWAQRGDLSAGLAAVLSGLSLQIPPLRDCPRELEEVCRARLEKYLAKYQRFFSITKGGRSWLLSQKWPGNHLQIDRFCERLVLTAPHRSIDERLLASLYRETELFLVPPQRTEASSYTPPEAAEILDALKQNLGNRRATAQSLGISTSTLWRKMNKYNISF